MAESSTEEDSSKNGAVVTPRETDHKSRKSVFQRSFSILGHLFHRTSKEDFERKLQYLSKEEKAVHTRMKRRSQTWRKLARGVIVYSVIMELLILGIAVIATKAPQLSWQLRALRVLPVFAFPALAALVYTTLASYYRMRKDLGPEDPETSERKDQKTLDRLRNERQAKIDELKERTNYYGTQQLIQKYDPDPAAKEAAARVLASKLATDAGLKVLPEPSEADGLKLPLAEAVTVATGQDVDSTGLRRRIPHQKTSSKSSGPSSSSQPFDEVTTSQTWRTDPWQQRMEVEQPSGKAGGYGWVARLAAMLVGEDPTQCYALICGNCHMHNGLSRKEEFQLINYYCPHCNFLNGPRQVVESRGGSSNSLEPSPRDGVLTPLKNDTLLANAPQKTLAAETGSDRAVLDRVEDSKSE